MAKNEKTGKSVGSIAGKALQNPGSVTKPEIRKMGASLIPQRPDHKKPGKK